jgi:hypothetical protein
MSISRAGEGRGEGIGTNKRALTYFEPTIFKRPIPRRREMIRPSISEKTIFRAIA